MVKEETKQKEAPGAGSLNIKPQKLKKLLPGNVIEELPYDPNRRPHKSIILDHIDEQIRSVELDRRLQVKKHLLFWFCMVCNAVGVTLTLFGLAITPLFQNYQPNSMMFICSFLLYIPFFLYIKMVYFPGGNEWSLRRYIVKARRWRNYVKREQKRVFLGKEDMEDFEDDVEEGGGSGSGSWLPKIKKKDSGKNQQTVKNSASFLANSAADNRKGSLAAMQSYKNKKAAALAAMRGEAPPMAQSTTTSSKKISFKL